MSVAGDGFWETELARFLPAPRQALEEALEYVACPVCHILARLPFEYFRLLPGRWPEEPQLREVVTAAGGFCNPHSWRFMSMQSNAAVARVLVDVLAWLSERPPITQGTCPVCQLQHQAQEVLVQLLAERLRDDAERERFGELFGLCYPHWREMLQLSLPAVLREYLVSTQTSGAAQLCKHLQGFLDKNTVELKWTRTLEENRSARHALLKTAGSEGM